jgi:hypothetical protein
MFNQGKKSHKRAEIGPSPSDACGEQNSPQASPQPQAKGAASCIAPIIPAFALALVAFAVYFNALSGAFVSDDGGQILANPWIKHLGNIPKAFSTNVWGFQWAGTSNYYRPLMHCVYTLTYQLFGLNPIGFHLVNVLFHCGVTVLVFLIVRQLLPRSQATPVWLSAPFLAALLFATHPIHTEDVAWVAALPDVAFTFFYLLSFYLYSRSRAVASRGYLFSLACFTVAVLFKEPALTLPVVLLAYDRTCREERFSLLESIGRYGPYFIVGAGYLALRIRALGGVAPYKTTTLSSYEVVINLFPFVFRYLEKLLLPIDLNYIFVVHPLTSLLEGKALISVSVTAVVVILALFALKRNKLAFLGIVFVVVPLLPALDIPALGEYPFAERYLYLPSVGFVFLLALFLSWAEKSSPKGARAIAAGFLLLATTYAIGTVRRNHVWQSDYDLWTDTVAKSPDSAWAHDRLGMAYRHRKMPVEAIQQYQAAIALKPNSDDDHNNLAAVYEDLGMTNEALGEIQIAIAIDPTNAAAHHNLGVLYNKIGMKNNARIELTTALSLKPDDESARRLLGETP